MLNRLALRIQDARFEAYVNLCFHVVRICSANFRFILRHNIASCVVDSIYFARLIQLQPFESGELDMQNPPSGQQNYGSAPGTPPATPTPGSSQSGGTGLDPKLAAAI